MEADEDSLVLFLTTIHTPALESIEMATLSREVSIAFVNFLRGVSNSRYPSLHRLAVVGAPYHGIFFTADAVSSLQRFTTMVLRGVYEDDFLLAMTEVSPEVGSPLCPLLRDLELGCCTMETLKSCIASRKAAGCPLMALKVDTIGYMTSDDKEWLHQNVPRMSFGPGQTQSKFFSESLESNSD